VAECILRDYSLKEAMTKDSKYDNNLSENGQLQLNQYFRRRSSF